MSDGEDQRFINGIIPDMIIDARGRINCGTFPDNNRLDNRVSLFEHKTLASLNVAVESRVDAVQSDLKSMQRFLMPVIPARLLFKSSRLKANTLSWSRVP